MLVKGLTHLFKKIPYPLNKNTNLCMSVFTQIPLTMTEKTAEWKQERIKYLKMKISDKRLEYVNPTKYTTIKDIPTWPQFLETNSDNSEKIPILSNHELEESLNKIVAEKVSVFHGDITTLEIDAIVNAANESLLGGGGVDGAIHKAAGPFLKKENKTLNGCEIGEAKISGGYKLPAKYVISTVGPRGEKPKDLTSCYKNSLHVLKENSLRSIAFPCISTGIFGYPNDAAAHVAIYETRKFLENNHEDVDRVIFCLFLDVDKIIYNGLLQSYFPVA